jgi:hypothetical protein
MSVTAPRSIADAAAGVVAALLATVAFVVWRTGTERWASAWPGHALGVLGIALMLWAGFAYTWRKRATSQANAPMRAAMRTHVIAGLLGPYLVILHSGLAFHGLAGVLTLLTVLVVASGLVGRAVFTAVPRQVAVADPVRAAMLEADLARLEASQADLLRADVPPGEQLDAVRRRMVEVRHEQEHLRNEWREAGPSVLWRRVMSVWWLLHVPLSLALWVLAAAHVVATLYYRTYA